MNHILLSLGSNVGDREANLKRAQELLGEEGVVIEQLSPIYETEPYGVAEQGYFLNQVVQVKTEKTPEELLETCLAVENTMGRVRNVKNGPRLIDVDVVFYRDEVLNTSRLTLPHPGVPERRFILQPLSDLVPGQAHPVLKKTVQQLLDECTDHLIVRPYGPHHP